MAYDLTKYRLQPGDLVEVRAGRCGLCQHLVGNEVVAEWDFSLGNIGTVIRLWQPHPRENVPPRIIVEPILDFGFGEHTFAAKWVQRVGEWEHD